MIIEAFNVFRGELNVENFVLTKLAFVVVTAALEDSHGKSLWRVQGTCATFSLTT